MKARRRRTRPGKKRGSTRRRPRQLEHAEQVRVVHWLEAADYLLCSIPNEAKRSVVVAAMLKAAGLRKGAPDLLVFDPPPTKPEFVGAALQMKQPNAPKKVPEEQEDWLIKLAARGWATKVAWSAVEALNWLASLGYRVPHG